MKIDTVSRPYLVTFMKTGQVLPLTSEEAQRLIDTYLLTQATPEFVVLAGVMTIQPATRGGGPAFVITG